VSRLLTRHPNATASGCYVLVSFLYLGLPALVQSGHRYVGYGYDPQIFIWSFAWWPHAVLHGQNPIVTHAVWAPVGLNLTWTTTVPGLAYLFAPLTLLAGATVSYDIAAVLVTALSAWTAYLLCRYLTRAFWPSLVGGYLFGFSSYVLAQGGRGHLHLSAVFLVPLVPLVVLRFLDGRTSGRRLAVELGVLFAFQILFSTEVAFTLAVALAVGLVLAYVLVPARRARLRAAALPVAGAVVVTAVLTAPFLYYLATGFQSQLTNADAFVADLANYVVPTRITAIGGSWFDSLTARFPGNPSEQDAYLGVPLLVIVALFGVERFRSPGGRFLLVCLAVAFVATLGPRLTVGGRSVGWAPWSLVRRLPVFENVFTTRLPVYVSLVAGVVVALWMAGRRSGTLRWLLPALAVLALVPDPVRGGFAGPYGLPAFFTSSSYRDCLDPRERVVPFPYRGGFTLLWQPHTGFRWNLAGGDLGPAIPSQFETAENAPELSGLPLRPDQVDEVRAFLQSNQVTSIVVDGSYASDYTPVLDQIATPHRVGGVVLYHLTRFPPPCPSAE
jgi:hypothetical protein